MLYLCSSYIKILFGRANPCIVSFVLSFLSLMNILAWQVVTLIEVELFFDVLLRMLPSVF